MPLNFHILDCFARDEKIMSETATEKVVQYTGDGDEDDEEFQTPARSYKEKTDKKDHANKSFIVHLFGKTADGTSIRADIRGFKPFFFVKAPDGPASVHEKARLAVVQYLGRHIYPAAVANSIQVEKCRRKELFGFTQDREVNMLRITVPSKGLFNDVKNCFCNGAWEPELKTMRNGQKDAIGGPYGATVPTVYEANLDPMLRFLHLRNLKPCNWCTIEDIDEDEFEDNAVTLECNWEDIGPCSSPPRATAPFKIASWDIECMSTTGAFPVAAKGDPIIQIGTILGTLGEPETEKHIFVLGTCDKIPDGIVHTFKKEREMILAWCNWMDEQGIDILMGYNIFGFDERYLWDRAVFLGIEKMMEIQQLNRLHEEGQMMRLDEKRLSSSAMGDNFMWLWNTTGRLRVDLFHYIKRGYPLPSYKLDDTSRNFLGEAVKGIEQKVDGWLLRTKSGKSNQDIAVGRSLVLLNDGGDSLCEKVTVVGVEDGCITIEVPDDVVPDEVSKWAIVKDDVTPAEMFKMHQQGPKERAIVARYCIQDCQLVLDLFKKLDVFNNSMSMANVCSVPVGYIFLRGQGVKIESLMFKYCYERGQCIMVLPSAKVDGETYEGAIVLDPTPGFYTAPVGVADFASLYPSTIISENISHDTLVWVKDYNEKGELLAHVWGSDEYDNVEGQRYTDIEYDNMIDDPEDQRKVKRKIKAGIRVCRYAQDKIGTIPQIVAGLLAARKAKRKEGEKATDPFVKALLDSEQLAYKLTANSLYGQLGSGTFKVRLRPLAASVTAYGRKQIMFSKTAIETFYGPESGNPRSSAVTVYGDTDSLFIAFHPKDPATGKPLEGKEALEATIALTEEAGKFVSKMLKSPHDFEFDKVYWPFIIFSKKRYVGHKYEDPDHPDKYKLAFMGVALKRRDYAPIVKRIYSSALNVMLHERNVAKAAGLVQQMTRDLVEGRFGLQPLIISKSLKSEYANPKSIAHKVLADRITARDPGNAPASGDRIPFVYIQPQVGQAAPDLQGDRIETPTYIKENGLKPDYMFYIDHQIANPVCQLFGVVVEQIPGFSQQPVPKGGWSEDPEKLAVQRETTAYNLLFADAITSNNKGAKRAFGKLLGAETTPTTAALSTGKRAPRALPSSTASAAPKKQSVLDSMFMDVLKVAASKEIQKQKKAEEKKKAAAETAPAVDAEQPKQRVTRRLKGTISAEVKEA